jgi:ArsR family transcriptional regulator
MANIMEIPTPIQNQVEKKGGIKTISDILPGDDEIQQKSRIYHALSDPLRLKILNLLIEQPLCVCLIKEVVKISDSKLSYHLSILTESGLIEGKRKASWIIYYATKLGEKYRL